MPRFPYTSSPRPQQMRRYSCLALAAVALPGGVPVFAQGPTPTPATTPAAITTAAAVPTAAQAQQQRPAPRQQQQQPPQAPGQSSGANPPAAPGTPLPARGTYRITGNAESMSVFAISVDAQELFTAIADKASLPLVADDPATLSRRITINIASRPARQILNDIVSAYGLSAAEVEGVLMISEGIPRSPSSYLLSDISSIPTKYVNAANARNLLPVFLQDHVRVNSEQNAVVLSAPTEVLGKFREDIAQFDIPASQIAVELLLIELTDATVDQLGLAMTYQNGSQGVSIDPLLGTVTYRAITDLPDQFLANLRALEEKGRARVRANPRIATVSGRRADIFVGRQRYVATPIDTGQGGQRNFIDAGVRLEITPFTGGQGQILVDVEAEVSTLSAPDPTTNLPEKSTRTAETIVRVNNGQTIVIGGLTQQESREVRTKIPVLGDIPLLGPLLFQGRDRRSTQTELVLFITPRILSDTGHLPEAEEKALKDRFLNSDLSKPLPPAERPADPPIPPSLRLPEPGKEPMPQQPGQPTTPQPDQPQPQSEGTGH